MMENFDSIKKQLSELATVLNAFKSEALQLRILEVVLDQSAEVSVSDSPTRRDDETRSRRRQSRARKVEGRSTGNRKKASPGIGAPATLTQLVSGNFFEKTRTINDIIEHCKRNLARSFKANEFSGKLGRMVRNGELTRKKSADKQYEYKKP